MEEVKTMISKCPKCRSLTYRDSYCGSCGHKSSTRQSLDFLYKKSPNVRTGSKQSTVERNGSTGDSPTHIHDYASTSHSQSSSDNGASDSGSSDSSSTDSSC